MTIYEDRELFAFTNCRLVNQGNTTLIVNQENNNELVVQPEVAIALTHLTHFKTLANHALDLINIFPQLQGDISGTEVVLKSVRDAGLLLNGSDIIMKVQSGSIKTCEPLPPSRVFIITCDRPVALSRLLTSMLKAGQLELHDAIFVIDNSRQEINILKNQKFIANFNQTNLKKICYFGEVQQDELLFHLINSDPEAEIGIRFLVDRKKWLNELSFGLSRNLCLLLSVGYRALILDDDILCGAVKAPLTRSALIFGDGSNRQAVFYPSRNEMEKIGIDAGFNPLVAHLRVLGENINSAISLMQHGKLDQKAIHGCNAAFLNSIESNSPVLISQCGSWGDPGTFNPHWIMHLDEISVAKIVETSGGLSEALNNRACWVGHARPCFSKNANISQLTGLANSYLLPPYFPIFRGEDSLFGTMTNCLHPNSIVANLNWAVPHLPIEDRLSRGVNSPVVGDPGLGLISQYLSEILDSKKPNCASEHLISISEVFSSHSSTETIDILNLFKAERRKRLNQALSELKLRLQSTNIHSRSWIAYLKRGIEELEIGIKNVDGIQHSKNEGRISSYKEMALEFSIALSSWEVIRKNSSDFSPEFGLL